MARVVPTVLASSPKEYAAMLSRAENLSNRVHVDVSDGQFAHSRTIGLAQLSPLEGLMDLHLMLEEPASQIETALSLHPSLVIIHAEANGNLEAIIDHIKALGVRAGLAVLPQTPVDQAAELIKALDHVLVFTGHLGFNGGEFQQDQLRKVAAIRELNANIEISVDGGVNEENAGVIAAAGVDVLYAGSSVQSARNPLEAFKGLSQAAGAAA